MGPIIVCCDSLTGPPPSALRLEHADRSRFERVRIDQIEVTSAVRSSTRLAVPPLGLLILFGFPIRVTSQAFTKMSSARRETDTWSLNPVCLANASWSLEAFTSKRFESSAPTRARICNGRLGDLLRRPRFFAQISQDKIRTGNISRAGS